MRQTGLKTDGWLAHHINPLQGGGTDGDDNLVLVRNKPRPGQVKSDLAILSEAQRGEVGKLNGSTSGAIKLTAPQHGSIIWTIE